MMAVIHAKKPKCLAKKQKKKKALIKCDEPDCDMQFLYKKELSKHKSECHPRRSNALIVMYFSSLNSISCNIF